jgi:mRNA interferase RelE/StbE
MFTVQFSRDAIRALMRMPRNTATGIRRKIDRLAEDPHAANNNVTKLTGRDGFRLRVGDWRVIYELDDRRRILSVLVIGPRGSVYR